MSINADQWKDAIVWLSSKPEAPAALKPLPTGDNASLLKQLNAWYKAHPLKDYPHTNNGNLAAGLSHAGPEGVAALKRLQAYLGGQFPAFDVMEDAAVLCLITDAEGAPPLIALWLRLQGLNFTFDTFCASYLYDRRSENGDNTSWPVWVERWAGPGEHVKAGGMEVTLRALISGLSPEERAALHQRAVDHRAKGNIALRCALTWCFEDEAWAAEDAEALLARPEHVYRGGGIVPVLRDPALLARLADFHSGYYAPYREDPNRLIERLGFDALPVLEIYCEKDDHRIASAISNIQCVRSAELLVQFLDSKNASYPAKAFFAARPDLALRALGPIVAGRSRMASKAEPTVMRTLLRNPGLREALRSHLDEKTWTFLERWDPPRQPVADASKVHPALKDAPWKKKVTPLPTLALTLTAPYVPAWADQVGRQPVPETFYAIEYMGITDDIKPRTPEFDAFTQSKLEELSAWERKYLLDACTDAGGQALWEAHNAAYFASPKIDQLYRRFGTSSWPKVLEEIANDPAWAVENVLDVPEPRLARLFALALEKKPLRALARRWFVNFPEAAALGLLPLVFGSVAKDREMAQRALRLSLVQDRAAVARAAASYGPEAVKALAAFEAAPADIYPKKLPYIPEFASAKFLPQLLLADGGALSPDQTDTLLMLLAFSGLEPLYVLSDIKETLNPQSANAFVWALFQQWLGEGANNMANWCLSALGYLGTDDTARRLTPLLREWPGEAASARAVNGLDVLARIGSDTALTLLHGIAQKLKFKGLQDKAREKIAQIAEDRGLSADALADRLVPDLDLDDNGTRVLDFGPRQFVVGFDEALSPFVRDANGKKLPDLPKPNKADTAAMAKEATDIWKLLKKDVRAIADSQIMRLEQIMCSQRRFPMATFQMFFIDHPLMIHLVRRLVWGVYEGDTLKMAFRVAEDRSLADIEDNPLVLADDANIGLVHRLEIDDAQVTAWTGIFGDYELFPPFQQLNRKVFHSDASANSEDLLRESFKTKTGKVLALEKQRGWRKGENEQGSIESYIKPLSKGVYAELPIDGGIYLGYMDGTPPEQGISRLRLRGTTVGQLNPVLISELLRDFDSLRG